MASAVPSKAYSRVSPQMTDNDSRRKDCVRLAHGGRRSRYAATLRLRERQPGDEVILRTRGRHVSAHAKDVVWTASGMGGAKALAFVAAVLLARALPPSQFGRFVILSTVAVVLIPVLDAGFSSLIFRVASNMPDRRPLSLLRPGTQARWAVWSSMLVVFTSAGYLLGGGREALEWSCVMGAAIGQAQLNAATGDLQGRGAFLAAAITGGLAGLAAVAAAMVVLWQSDSALAAIAAFMMARALPAAVLTVATWRRPAAGGGKDLAWRRALPLAVFAILAAAYVRSDVIIMGFYGMPSASVAVYGVVYQWAWAGQLLPAAAATVAFPAFVHRNERAAHIYIKTAQFALLGAAVFVCLSAWQSARVFGLFGQFYAENIGLALPLLTALVPFALSITAINALTAAGKDRAIVTVGLAGFVVNVGLNLLLIPLAGVPGAIAATLAAETVVAVASMGFAARAGFPLLSWQLYLLAGACTATGVLLGGAVSIALAMAALAFGALLAFLVSRAGDKGRRPAIQET